MHSFRNKLILLIIISQNCLQADDVNWSRFRGPQGSGISSNTEIPLTWSETENIAWQVNLPGEGASSPVIWKEHIYLTTFTRSEEGVADLKRHVLCLNRHNGDEIWRHTIPAELPEQETIREKHGYATNTPAVDKDRIYLFLGKSGVLALNHQGKKLWQTHVGSKIHGWGSAASLSFSTVRLL